MGPAAAWYTRGIRRTKVVGPAGEIVVRLRATS